MKIRLKAKDSKEDAIQAVRATEEKFPDLELVHRSANKKFQYSLYNLKEEKYENNLTADHPFIKELKKRLEGTDYDLFKVQGLDQVQIKGVIEGVSNNTWEIVPQRSDQPDLEEDIYEEEDQTEDTRWNYGTVTAGKLEEFLDRYGRYLKDEDAKLVYKRNRSLWGPSFSYKRDDTPGVREEDIPTEEIKTEIYEYIDRVFFGG